MYELHINSCLNYYYFFIAVAKIVSLLYIKLMVIDGADNHIVNNLYLKENRILRQCN